MTLKNLLLAHKKMCGEPIGFIGSQLFFVNANVIYR